MTSWSQMSLISRALVLLAFAIGTPLAAKGSLAMLDSLDRGAWQLQYRDGTGVGRICLRTGRELIQLRHPAQGCERVVVSDNATDVTVQYTCAAKGYARTRIRMETHGLVQIESQGIAGGKPFQLAAEARRVGSCGS